MRARSARLDAGRAHLVVQLLEFGADRDLRVRFDWTSVVVDDAGVQARGELVRGGEQRAQRLAVSRRLSYRGPRQARYIAFT